MEESEPSGNSLPQFQLTYWDPVAPSFIEGIRLRSIFRRHPIAHGRAGGAYSSLPHAGSEALRSRHALRRVLVPCAPPGAKSAYPAQTRLDLPLSKEAGQGVFPWPAFFTKSASQHAGDAALDLGAFQRHLP